MMWRSHEDFIKDIVALEDADVAENTYKVLQSYGRGVRASGKQGFSEGVIDPRTGNPVGVHDYVEITDFDSKSRGRGRLSCYSKSHLQLQKQLRSLKPLGSSDDIIEAYCRRKAPAPAKPPGASDSATEAGRSDFPGSKSSDFYSTDTTRRTIAFRNSKLQSNALISSLLSKMSVKENERGVSDDGDIDRIDKNGFSKGRDGEDEDDGFTSTCVSTPYGESPMKSCNGKYIFKNSSATEKNVNKRDFIIRDNEKKNSGDLLIDSEDFPPLKRH